MATAIAHHDANPVAGLFSRGERLLARLARAFAEHRAYVALRDELDVLTDRELADLGVHRANIREIARGAAGI
ncbi:DUF1127 domain-containing protein [Amaricoccus sp.]|uniref:DUF1127 domain-containing protein n=1 Tax=Amaricoccus sp. TaxID=1872485 RepID=UPI001B51FE1F|nr:DUF1127 domain-containing protein [Amaricoccus sp.]MBP7003243.1 DUF1127 domain-containing protein [Amaricoccus sp.]